MTIKLYLEPDFNKPDKGDGGIRRVVEAQRQYLPEFGFRLVSDKAKADITAGHGAIVNLKEGAPFVSHSHGLYWSEYRWDDWARNTNRAVIDAMVCADAITVPSQWVKLAYGRGMLRRFKVIYHGIEVADWKHSEKPQNYVLWNKSRHDAVSNADEVTNIASRMPGTQFVSTIVNKPMPNIKLCGVASYSQHKKRIQQAGVYLATARETFGIGTLEALAAGVPIAGWKHGGQCEIVIEGETGYLAEPGNYEQLAECIQKCFDRREILSRNARADAVARWGWKDKIEQYAQLYTETLERYRVSPKVSVIITCHNLAPWLNAAVQSVERQTFKDWECIIVDDASTDKTPDVSQSWVELDPRISYERSDTNLKLCGARNLGIAKSKGKYIINLDADDELTENALGLLVEKLDTNSTLHIAYGGLDLIDDKGENRRPNPFPGKFDWTKQMAHLNQLSYAAMMRRTVLEDVGNFRVRMWRAEDAEFWCRATSYGFRAAKVTDEPILLYRIRADSKGAQERKKYADVDGNWCADFPWAIASSANEGTLKLKQQNFPMPHKELVPFGAPTISGETWTVSHRQAPQISVIIPLGEGHEQYIIDALDSLIAQTVGNWEAIVIDDTGKNLTEIPGAPYARIIHTKGKQGAGVARNLGINAARAPFVFFLDADDTILPHTFDAMMKEYAKGAAGYVYSDWLTVHPDGSTRPGRANEYSAEAWITKGQHAVTVLMATADAKRIGGFDEEMPGWEDWDFFIKCGINGICGAHIPEGLLIYREHTGTRRQKAFARKNELLELLHNRYKEYAEGSKKIMPCCGGHKSAVSKSIPYNPPSVLAKNTPNAPEVTHPEKIKMEFLGRQMGPIPYTVNNHIYYGANTNENRYADVLWADVPKLERLGVWRKAQSPEPAPQPQPAPAPAPVPTPAPQVITIIDAPTPVAAVIPVEKKEPAAIAPDVNAEEIVKPKRKPRAAAKKK